MTIAALSLLAVLANRQAKREAIMGELEHRVKNTLALVATVIERARNDTKSIDEAHPGDGCYTDSFGPEPLECKRC